MVRSCPAVNKRKVEWYMYRVERSPQVVDSSIRSHLFFNMSYHEYVVTNVVDFESVDGAVSVAIDATNAIATPQTIRG